MNPTTLTSVRSGTPSRAGRTDSQESTRTPETRPEGEGLPRQIMATNLNEVLHSASSGDAVWLRVGTLLDGTSERPQHDVHLVYDAEKIRHVGTEPPAGELRPGKTEPDAHLPDVTVLPGLIEAHSHLFLEGAPVDFENRKAYLAQSDEFMLEQAKGRLEKLLRLGIMAMRDGGDNRKVGLALKRAYHNRNETGELVPLVDTPGAGIHHEGRYGGFMGEPLEQHASVEDCVAQRAATGADRIKLIATGIISFKSGKVVAPPQSSLEEVKEVVAAAKRHGKPTLAHASGEAGIENVIEGGIDTVEHGFFITRDQLAKMRDRQIGWVPTFAPVQIQIERAAEIGRDEATVGRLRRIIDGHRCSLELARTMGVPVLGGCDCGSCGVPHGLGLIYELECMAESGMSPLELINTVTGTNAEVLNFPEPIGRLQAGYRSRMIFTTHDPLESISNLRKKKWCVFDQHVLESAEEESEEGL